ncbi:hypothetical protein VDG1235_2856 [Verrucomicrobiia bacterium DG1235]|nr:hypothetical protein VDG1235_2856 [Verrucomicrobiae bacterium DG1235]
MVMSGANSDLPKGGLRAHFSGLDAALAQLVEQLIRNE